MKQRMQEETLSLLMNWIKSESTPNSFSSSLIAKERVGWEI